MVFSSYLFLFLFLPLSIGLYFATPNRLRNLTLLILSYLFYGWGAPRIAPLLLALSLFDYVMSRPLGPEQGLSQRARAWLLAFGIGINLSLLIYYKYTNFFLTELRALLLTLGFSGFTWEQVLLPIGISFFTFQKISYLVDVYHGTAKRAESFVDYALFVALFPQLIAGPIVRYHELATQLVSRRHTWFQMGDGLQRFCIGLGKKVLIADYAGQIATAVFALPPDSLLTSYAWLGILAYTFQIYFDFSGYSDMAIGLGQVFGFTFPENFKSPYRARSFQEFWSRWHITLSNFMKEYLYIPLGGSRRGRWRTFINLWIVFLLSGLWHGASWNFLVWGGFHGFWLSLERAFSFSLGMLVFPLIVLSWVPFRAEDLVATQDFFLALFHLSEPTKLHIAWGDIAQPRDLVVLALAFIITFFGNDAAHILSRSFPKYSQAMKALGALAIFILSTLALAGLEYTPFLYFRF